MIRCNFILWLTIATVSGSAGCQSPLHNAEVRNVDPALPMTMECAELVTYLNRQNQGLQGWRCTSTTLHVRLPNGITQRLNGNIACQAPHCFRLKASNLIATADIGSNASRCWFYSHPGDPALITWKHEDTPLLAQIPSGIPYIDPNWLMLVLGVKPLDAEEYAISKAPGGLSELWLTSIEDNPGGRPMRRVIKVDTVRGVIREHALYDSEANPLVRAQLSQHKSCGGSLLPGHVQLLFPQMDSEMVLKFNGVETNPSFQDELWRLPDNNMHVVDLGEVIRRKIATDQRSTAQTPQLRLQPPDFGQSGRSAFVPPTETRLDGSPVSKPAIDEPDWDHPISASRTVGNTRSQETFNGSSQPRPRRSVWSWFRPK